VTQPSHHDQLCAFAEYQLGTLSTRDICASTVHLILATAFFTGAAIGLAKALKAPKKTYLASLRTLLQDRFGLSADNAVGLIESNARLYKRYVLIEQIYSAGLQAAQHWTSQSDAPKTALTDLLQRYRDLSMSGLNVEGVKQPKPAPAPVESITNADIQPAPTPPPPRWGRRLAWLLFFSLLGLLVAGLLFPEAIPTSIKGQLLGAF